MVKNKQRLENNVYPVPEDIDQAIAKEKLTSMKVKIDTLTPEQKKYLASWSLGT
jgi:adenosylhomocysteinase